MIGIMTALLGLHAVRRPLQTHQHWDDMYSGEPSVSLIAALIFMAGMSDRPWLGMTDHPEMTDLLCETTEGRPQTDVALPETWVRGIGTCHSLTANGIVSHTRSDPVTGNEMGAENVTETMAGIHRGSLALAV